MKIRILLLLCFCLAFGPVIGANANRNILVPGSSISVSSELDEGPRKVWFHLRDLLNLQYTEALLGFLEGATEGWDNIYDASPSSNGFRLSSLVGEKPAVIQGLPPFTGNEVVMWEAKTTLPGSFSFVKDRDVDFQEDIWLRDLMTNEVVKLSEQPMTYLEILPNGVRFFEMYFKDPNLGIEYNRFEEINALLFQSTEKGTRVGQKGIVQVVNMNGQIVQQYSVNAGQYLRNFPTQLPHFVKFENQNLQTVKKFIR